MKLPIRHEYFQKILEGSKGVEYRDAHITFVDEKTGDELRKDIQKVDVVPIQLIDPELYGSDMFTDSRIMVFHFIENTHHIRPRRTLGEIFG